VNEATFPKFVEALRRDRIADEIAQQTVEIKRPFAVRLFKGNAEVKVFEACWNQPRCAEKRKLLEKLLVVNHQ
jgi:hypothetical protein